MLRFPHAWRLLRESPPLKESQPIHQTQQVLGSALSQQLSGSTIFEGGKNNASLRSSFVGVFKK
jgi:hypothetical protein